MSKEELNRLLVIQKHIEGLITINEAAKILDLSSRQVKRLKKGVLEPAPYLKPKEFKEGSFRQNFRFQEQKIIETNPERSKVLLLKTGDRSVR